MKTEYVSPEILRVQVEGYTDYYIDPFGNYKSAKAPVLGKDIEGDFVMRAHFKPNFRDVYDAASLMVIETDERYVKFCYEKLDSGGEGVVTVVTDFVSDDANGVILDGGDIWFQIIRVDDTFAMHYSKNGKEWKMARYFKIDLAAVVFAGIEFQSPREGGTSVDLHELSFSDETIMDLRKGE